MHSSAYIQIIFLWEMKGHMHSAKPHLTPCAESAEKKKKEKKGRSCKE